MERTAMPHRIALNEGWQFCPDDADPTSGTQLVTLPHSAVDLPLNYFDETIYQRSFTYQRRIDWTPDMQGRDVWLRFDGVMADACVQINGVEVARHHDGYTPFDAPLTPHLVKGSNIVTVTLSGAENPEIPPFGGQIDYLTYAGIYRDVWLRSAPSVRIAQVKIETPDPLGAQKTVLARVILVAADGVQSGTVIARILDASGAEIATQTVPVNGTDLGIRFDGLKDLSLWDMDNPVLYTLELTLQTPAGTDCHRTDFGIRHAEFTPQGFMLNGRPVKLRGLNRHQSFPYSGYAQGRRSQERDAEILKYDLGCNIVRTSHYPQSPWFLDHCDRIGLLVFEEIPGWQHIGDAKWKTRAVANVAAMIRRDWNHPSVILWGVRINESADDHDFYSEANRIARELDPTRQTGGVRCITDSEMLEDVYTMNDFILGDFEKTDSNRPRTPLRPITETTGLRHPVPYLVTEYNGHMFPTKAGDPEQRHAEHAIRHLEVLNAAFGDPGIAGAIGWCFADYNTHKDFGSGDRICHHGVTDMFRNLKPAGYVYASQQDPAARIVFEPVTCWARGERNIGGVLPLIVLTNCDAVELTYGGSTTRVGPDHARFPHLPYPPVIIEQRHLSPDALGRWGMAWKDGVLTGWLAGKQVAQRHFVADPVPTRLEMLADTTKLNAATQDETRVVLRGLDQAGNPLRFLNETVQIRASGPVRLIGPDHVTLCGGMAGFWLRTTGQTGDARIVVSSPRFGSAELTITAQ
ncbi:glycoside hydrolase family 2 TIM barrel-domain containing protein (plasmid) [Roseinatronobacter sp. S2]|nr:glycoside hydrolase family 2 TIM barrel-domain containing protein [Roseinatronobacter sp. S2]WFE76921.1 glycoside hydrolase family 2 TIM barrel-domain containing protein [Roseinatronobacter sp. S2]